MTDAPSSPTAHLHLVYFERCRRLCDLLVVGVDSDDLVRKAKGDGRPVIPEHQRVAMVASQKSVGAAFVMGDVEAFGRWNKSKQPLVIPTLSPAAPRRKTPASDGS